MATMTSLTVNLLGNAKQLQSTLTQAKGNVAAFRNDVGSLTSAVGGKLIGAVTGLLTVASGVELVKMASQLEDAAVQMEVLTGSAEEAKRITQELRQMGAATPFEYEDLAKSTVGLLSMSRPLKSVISDLQLLTNIAAGDANKLSSVVTVFGQISSNGRLNGGDLQQLVNVGFNPLNEIAKKTGESMEALRARMSAGKVTFDEVRAAFQAVTEAGGAFHGMNERMSQTLSGRFSTLVDNLKTAGAGVGGFIATGLNLEESMLGASIALEYVNKKLGFMGTEAPKTAQVATEIKRVASAADQAAAAAKKMQESLKAAAENSGALDQYRQLRDEIALLEGSLTRSDIAVRDLLGKGATPQQAELVGDLMDLKDVMEEQKQLAEEAKRNKEQMDDMLRSKAESLIESTRTPMEQFKQRVQEMQELLEKGLINEETLQRGIDKAKEQLDLATQEKDKQLDSKNSGPRGLVKGSAEAAQAIIAARINAAKPEGKLENLGKLQLAELQQVKQLLIESNSKPGLVIKQARIRHGA